MVMMDFLDHLGVINRKENLMKELSFEQLEEVKGGISITGTFINAIVRGIDVIMELGRSLGSAFRRSMDHQLCPY